MYKPFNLQAALAGAPVVTRDVRPVKIAGYNEDANSLLGWIGNDNYAWTGGGKSFRIDFNFDLFMAPTTRKEWIVRYGINQTCMGRQVMETSLHTTLDDAHKEISRRLRGGRVEYSTIHEITITE
jgi:hypothetical protein